METEFKYNDGLPEKYYKYHSLSGASALHIINNLLHRQVHFSSPNSFNDPFDCRPSFANNLDRDTFVENYIRCFSSKIAFLPKNYLQADAEKIWSANAHQNGGVEAMVSSFQKMLRVKFEKTAIYCVSEVNDDILMWSHYADCHRGICLEFSPGSHFLQNVLPVDYREVRPQLFMFDHKNEVANMKHSLLTKSIHWEYEKEWRVLDINQPAGLREFNQGDLTGIIFGSAISLEMEKTVRSIIRVSAQEVKFYKAVIDDQLFRLRIELA